MYNRANACQRIRHSQHITDIRNRGRPRKQKQTLQAGANPTRADLAVMSTTKVNKIDVLRIPYTLKSIGAIKSPVSITAEHSVSKIHGK